MSIKFIYQLPLLLLPLLGVSQGFTTSGSELKDANGNTFIMKGMNVPLAWYQSQTLANIKNIKKNSGSNTLRLVVGGNFAPNQDWYTPDATWQAAIDSTIKNKMIPMVEIHNVLGSNDSLDLNKAVDWWVSKKDYFTRPDIAKYILVNIANEWGDWYMSQASSTPPNQVYWRDSYVSAVKKLRAAGYKTTIVIDAPGYGQDKGASALLAHAQTIINADPLKNVLFGIHTYCEWNSSNGANSSTVFPQLKAAKIPFFVGEVANTHPDGANTCQIPATTIMGNSVQYNSGYLGWSWTGNGASTQALDASSNWEGTQLTPWGEILINSPVGTKSAMEASVFGGTSSNKAPTVTLTSPKTNATFPAPASITLEATAADEDGKVRRVVFYEGSTQIGQDTSAPYSFTWENVAKGTYSFSAFAVDNENASGTSNSVSVLVSSADGNLLENGDFESGSTGWTFYAEAPGAGTMTVATDATMSGTNSLRVCPTNPGTKDYSVQVYTKAAIVKDQTFELTFLGKADSARTIKVGFQQNGGKWRFYTGADFSLSATAQLYSYSFKADTTDPNMDIKFFFGLSMKCVNIDNVIFSAAAPLSLNDTEKDASIAKIFPNPFSHSISIQSKGDFRYEIRNQLGQLVEQGTGTDQANVAESAPKGFYLLRVINQSKTADKKIVKE